MLAIRLQRTGRKGHAQFRVVVQDARLAPTSGRVVASIGSYDPHSKQVSIVRDKAEFYLSHGAQPSPRVVSLLSAEGLKLPKWVAVTTDKTKKIKNVEKLRRNRPAEAAEPKESPAETPAADAKTEEPAAEVTTPEVTESPAEETSESVDNESTDTAVSEESTSDTDSADEPEKA